VGDEERLKEMSRDAIGSRSTEIFEPQNFRACDGGTWWGAVGTSVVRLGHSAKNELLRTQFVSVFTKRASRIHR
jgi:hypothetical protein